MRGECACEGWSDEWCCTLLFLSDAEGSSGAMLVEFMGVLGTIIEQNFL